MVRTLSGQSRPWKQASYRSAEPLRHPKSRARSRIALVAHGADFFFHFRNIHHDYRVPRASVEEGALWTLTEALLASDALQGVYLDAAERWMVVIWYPKHAIFDWEYSTRAGDPAQPVQHSVMTASSFGFFLRGVSMPFERGSCFSSSGTSPGAFAVSGPVAIEVDYIAGWGFCKVPGGPVPWAVQPLKG